MLYSHTDLICYTAAHQRKTGEAGSKMRGSGRWKNDTFRILLYVLIAVLLVILFFYYALDRRHTLIPKEFPRAEKGVLELNSWDFSTRGPVPLDGEWEFYPNRLLFPGDVFSGDSYTEVPSRWNYDDRIGNHGYATYRLVVDLAAEEYPLAIQNGSLSTAFRLFINGENILEVGQVGVEAESSQPAYRPATSPLFMMRAEKSYEIILQVSNWDYRTGGPWSSLWFGPYETLSSWHWISEVRGIILFSSLMIMAFFYTGVYLLRRHEGYYLYLSLLSLLFALRALFPDHYLILHFFPTLPFRLIIACEYLTLYLAVPAAAILFHNMYPRQFDRRLYYTILGTSSLFTLAVLILPPALFTYTVYPFYLFLSVSLFSMVYVMLKAVIANVTGALLTLLGTCFIIASIINDFFYLSFTSRTGTFIELGMIFFIFFQALALAMKMTSSFQEVQKLTESLGHLNENLEEEVERRTGEVRSAHEAMRDLEGIRCAEEERKRVGRDLHDTLGQSIHAMELLGESVRLQGEIPRDLERKIGGMLELNEEIKSNLYTIIGELYPVGIGERGLLAAIERDAENLMARHDLSVDIFCPVKDIPLDLSCTGDVYNIVREGMTNALRHASPEKITISLDVGDTLFTLRVTNDGAFRKSSGEPQKAQKSGGHGTSIMSYRAASHGGTFSSGYGEDGTYTIEATIPLKSSGKDMEKRGV